MIVTLDTLNALDRDGFVASLDGIYEHTPEIAATVWDLRPFATVASLHDAMADIAAAWPEERRVALIRAHPDLAGRAAREGTIAAASIAEQAGLGLDRLSEAEFELFERLNNTYRSRFGFPFVVCIARRTRDAVLRAYERRLGNPREVEIATAVEEITLIARLRLAARVQGPGVPRVHGRLSTHVLDTMAGRPASGVAIELFEIGLSARALLVSAVTNEDGRTDRPLLADAPLRTGQYELLFHLGDYFRAQGVPLADTPFLDQVPIRFGIDAPEAGYHVPLVATPWSYATYRGS